MEHGVNPSFSFDSATMVGSSPIFASANSLIYSFSGVDSIWRAWSHLRSSRCIELLAMVERFTVRSALVLNATFEPLSIVPARRAICLVLSDKAEIVEDDGTQVHAETFVMPGPLVIRLRYVVKVPYHRRTAMSRRAIFARDNHCCQYCGALADSIDHVMPRSRGGMHVWENVTAACRGCNLKKRDSTPDEAGMRLANKPHTPRELAWITVSVGRIPEAWKQYLAYAS